MNPLGPFAPRMTWLSAAFVTAFCALVATVGADAHWLAALGADVMRLGHVPSGIPYAAAPSAGWENAPVLGELVFHWLEAGLGDQGLLVAQGLAVALAFALLAADMRAAGAADPPSALVLLLIASGTASTLLVVRAQLFSVALFPALVLLLRREVRAPSAGVWLVVPLLALWANLHGGVLLGLAVTGTYLLVHRLRYEPFHALSVLAASAAACFATPALLGTAGYYRGVLFSEAASSGEGLWAPLSLSSRLDLTFVLVALGLLAPVLMSRPKAWELCVLAGLGAATAHVGRNGVWFLFFAAAPAAAGLTGARTWRFRIPGLAAAVLAAALLGLTVLGLARTPVSTAAGYSLRLAAVRAAGGTPILADDINAEALALDGRTVWIANPLDAFGARQQRLYLDWTAGRASGDPLLARARAVLVTRDTRPERRLAANPAFREAGRDDRAALYVRYRPARR